MKNDGSDERRRQRSEDPTVASGLYLMHLADRLGCEAIALSSPEGELLGGAGDGYDLGLLGTLASLGSQIGDYEPEQANEGALRFYGIELEGRRLFVSSVGGAPLPVAECAATLRRIHRAQAA